MNGSPVIGGLLVALSGGKPAEREAIARRLVDSGRVPLSAFSQPAPKAAYPAQRAKILRTALRGRDPALGVVVAHCLTEREAEAVRELGGVIWHLYSRPSALVVIRNGDQIVTDDEGGIGHVRAPLEALAWQLECLP